MGPTTAIDMLRIQLSTVLTDKEVPMQSESLGDFPLPSRYLLTLHPSSDKYPIEHSYRVKK